MRAMLLGLVLLTTAVIAGCITNETGPDVEIQESTNHFPEVTPDRAAALEKDLSGVIDEDHGGVPYLHAVPHLHEGIEGMELVGYNPLTRIDEGTNPLAGDSGYGALDIHENLVCVTHFAGSTGAQGGFTIVDIEDPAHPVVLSQELSMAVNSRCMFSDDGQYAFLATYTGTNPGNPLPPPLHDAAANGVSVYDVSDPANPQFLFHDVQGADSPASGSYHNIWTVQINGSHYIFQTDTGNILRLTDDASGLEMVGQLQHARHDFWGGKHPITGEWLIVAGVDYGFAVMNVDDPTAPELLGIWEGDREQRFAGWHRQFPLENTVDGRAYIVVAGEECGNGDSLPYQVVDWTDPSDMNMTGTWWIPGQPANPREAEPHLCEMNSHEFWTWNGYVATANYHAGLWLIDIGSTERAHEPATIGYYLPSEKPHEHGGTINAPFVWSPDVWGAVMDHRGYVVIADWWSGLYVLSFEGTMDDGQDDGHEH